MYLFGSDATQLGAIVILGHVARTQPKKSMSGLQGTRNAFFSINLIAKGLAMLGWSLLIAKELSFNMCNVGSCSTCLGRKSSGVILLHHGSLQRCARISLSVISGQVGRCFVRDGCIRQEMPWAFI